MRKAAAHRAAEYFSFCVLVFFFQMILNLEAASPSARASWLSSFHCLMSAAGKKRVFDEAEQQQQLQQQQQQLLQQ